MTTPTSWTRADDAELALLADELVRHAWPARHDPRARGAIREAVNTITDWRRARMLRTRAAALRARQDIADWRAAA